MTMVDERPATVSPEPLRQSDAVLMILQALQGQELRITHRLLLENLACAAHQPQHATQRCRILSVFDTDAWQRRLYESLAHLEQTGCVRTSREGYALTEFAQTRLGDLALTDAESERIQDLAETVKQYLSCC
ncbi:MAG: hypothetical protein OXH86_08455 [Acidimicrobiaceae bacterium]|nr:hypothetical protein [Acidimicrobiaceae bacterium]MDE0497369.1 hypothetical protein [Acidimicrobiaceae bacterium]